MEKSIKEYGLDYIKSRYEKFRTEFFEGDSGFLPKSMYFTTFKRTGALGQCYVKFPLGYRGPMANVSIKFSTLYKYNEVQLDEVLIHEMIHAYLIYKGHQMTDISLMNCGHGYPFLTKAAEINLNSGYNITVTNDKALNLSEEGEKKYLKADEVVLVTKEVSPGICGITKIKKKDIAWMRCKLYFWLNRMPEIYTCTDANFLQRFKTKRSRVGYVPVPEIEINKMIMDNKLKICA